MHRVCIARGRLVAVSILVVGLFAFAYCTTPPEQQASAVRRVQKVEFTPVRLLADSLFARVVSGKPLTVRLEGAAGEVVDSVSLLLGDRYLGRADSMELVLGTANWPMGKQNLRVQTWVRGHSRVHAQPVTVFAPVPPEEYTYRKLREYPHDTKAFTQGLLWANGYLYESTGQRGQSTMRKVDLSTGKVLQSASLAPSVFGEGVALLGSKFYQLSWTSRVGFIYDTATLKQVGTFQFHQQGWGLASDARWLYMTDGTENVYQISPKGFQVVRTIQVYDDKGKQTYLNELEIIDGLLYANIFLTDEIAVIDLSTGRILRRIDMSGLLPTSLYDSNTDILNGIAHDAQGGHTYVTGKYWPRLFEVEFFKKR